MLRSKNIPYRHQTECLEKMRNKPAFAVLMEQGLGKTKVVLDLAIELFNSKEIDGLLVIAPNGVHSNWIESEIPKHVESDGLLATFEYSARLKRSPKFRERLKKFLADDGRPKILSINVEAFSSDDLGPRIAEEFLSRRRSAIVVDESSRIKTPTASRTRKIVALGRRAVRRWILTGTPVTQTPFDLYSQFMFLDPKILGFSSYHGFRHHYGIWEKRVAGNSDRRWEYENLVRYVRLDDLARRIEPWSYRRTKSECLDLPKKIRQKFFVDPSPTQEKLLASIEEEGIIRFEDFEELTPLEITRLLRSQQIVGGFLPGDGGPLPENPKLDLLDDVVDDYPGKMVVWARFRNEISAIVSRLRKRGTVVEMHGGTVDKAESARRFQEDESVRFLVGQQQSGIGVDLWKAETVVYYSNSFSYEQRYQSEDRCHRIGLDHPVVYIDLVMRGTVDEKICSVLERSEKFAKKFLDGGRSCGADFAEV